VRRPRIGAVGVAGLAGRAPGLREGIAGGRLAGAARTRATAAFVGAGAGDTIFLSTVAISRADPRAAAASTGTRRATERTTLAIDDDILAAAKEMASTERKSIGEVISALARKALRPSPSSHSTRNGVPLLTVRPGAPRVTSELVRQLQEELP